MIPGQLTPILGVSFTVVEAGTEVGKDAQGNPVIVTEDAVVFKGSRAWTTQRNYDRLKAELQGKTP